MKFIIFYTKMAISLQQKKPEGEKLDLLFDKIVQKCIPAQRWAGLSNILSIESYPKFGLHRRFFHICIGQK